VSTQHELHPTAGAVEQAQPGMEDHLFPAHQAQLYDGILTRSRLAEAVAAVGGYLIGTDDQGIGVKRHDGAGLGFGQAQGGGNGGFSGLGGFVGLRRDGLERDLQARQKLAAEGRSGGKNERARMFRT
jgi:hypothetical protein